jgi:hypothetical protein
VVSTKRDLPAFYQASALVRGAIPETSHVKENLLRNDRSSHTIGLVRDLKRITNRALAVILIKESHGLDPKNSTSRMLYMLSASQHNSRRTGENTVMAIQWHRSSEVEVLCQAYQSRSESKEMNFKASHSAGGSEVEVPKAALQNCARSYFHRWQALCYRKSKPEEGTCKSSTSQKRARTGPNPEKRSTPDSESQVHFVVDVPTGLEVGDKFESNCEDRKPR